MGYLMQKAAVKSRYIVAISAKKTADRHAQLTILQGLIEQGIIRGMASTKQVPRGSAWP